MLLKKLPKEYCENCNGHIFEHIPLENCWICLGCNIRYKLHCPEDEIKEIKKLNQAVGSTETNTETTYENKTITK